MALNTLLCLSASLCLVASVFCPAYTCSSALNSTECGRFTSDNNVLLNENGCGEGYYCSGSQFPKYPPFTTRTSEDTILCYPLNVTFFSLFNASFSEFSLPCGTHRDPNKKFKNGGQVLSCTSDDDCQLVDGTKTPCLCNFKEDNIGLCIPPEIDEDWTEFWRDCGDSNVITDRYTVMYWSVYMWIWMASREAVSCIKIFVEFELLKDIQKEITTGASYDSDSVLAAQVTALGIFSSLALLY